MEKDKSCKHGAAAGLFRGLFNKHRAHKMKRGHRDPDDQVLRCPDCFWEVIEGICESCGNPVLDENAEPGMSDLSDVDMDFSDSGSDDGSTSSEEGRDPDHPIDLEAEDDDEDEQEIRRIARRRARRAANNSIIDLTGSSQPQPLAAVDEEDSDEEEMDSDDSLNDFVEPDTPQRTHHRRARRGTSTSRSTPVSYREASAETSSPVIQRAGRGSRRTRILDEDTSEASEESTASVRQHSTQDEEYSSDVSDGSSRVGPRRRGPYNYRSQSLASDEDEVSLLGGYQELREAETAEEDDDSDDTEGFSPVEDIGPTSSQQSNNAQNLGSDASSNTQRESSVNSNQFTNFPDEESSVASSPPTRPTVRRRGTVRHIARVPDEDEDDEDEWQDSSDDVDNEGDIRMSDNVSVASSRASHGRTGQARRRASGRRVRGRNIRSSFVIPDSDDETTDASSPPPPRRVANGVEFFSNTNSSSAARRAMSGSGRRPDPRIQNMFAQMSRTRGSSDASAHPLADLRSVSPARSVTPVPATAQTISSTVSSPIEQSVPRISNRSGTNNGRSNNHPSRDTRAVSVPTTRSQDSQSSGSRLDNTRSPARSNSPPRTDPNVPSVGLPYSFGLINTLRNHRLGHRSSRTGLRSSVSRNNMRNGSGSSPLSPTHTGRTRTSMSVAPQSTYGETPLSNSQRGSSAPAESPIIGNHATPITERVIHQEGQTLMQQRRMRSLEIQQHAVQQALRGQEMRRRMQEALERGQSQPNQTAQSPNAVPPQISTTAGLGRRTSRRTLSNQQPTHRLTPGSIPETAFPTSRQSGPRVRQAGVFEIGESEDSTRQGGPLWNIGNSNLR